MKALKKGKARRSAGRGRKVRATRLTPKTAKAKRGIRKPKPREVEIDEERERAGGREKAFDLGPDGAVDGVAEELGEGYVRSVTSGEQAAEDIRDEELPEEEGGPFIETTGRIEFAHGVDESNPLDAEPADLPTVSPYRRK